MEEATSWKNHTFTLLIFGGIIVLCSIFFVLGMVVGRNQGRQIAESAVQEREAKRTPAEIAGDTFKLNYFEKTTGDKATLSLEREPDPPAKPREEPAQPKPAPSQAATPPPPKPPAPPAVA